MSTGSRYKGHKTIVLSPTEAREHETLAAGGQWDETTVTLISPPGVPRGERRWVVMLKELLRLYHDERGAIIKYHIVLNRGKSGREDYSSHMICEPPLPDYEFLSFLWTVKLNNGKDGCRITVPGGTDGAARYQARNCAQPAALWWHWRYNPL